jgi:putative ATP-binding cassette transporter
LYAALEEAGITCVSVGHRDSILTFHQYELRLLGHGRWQIRRVASVEPAERAAAKA